MPEYRELNKKHDSLIIKGMDINIIPMNLGDKNILFPLKNKLGEIFGLPVKIGDQIDTGHEFFSKGRRQYNASRILDFMAIELNLLPQRIYLAVFGSDMYVASLNFVFGISSRHPRISLISTARLDPAFYSAAGQKPITMKIYLTIG